MLIDWFTVAAQVVNFLILVWLLKRYLYKPILHAIDKREERIAAELDDAETNQNEALAEREKFFLKNEEFEQQRTQKMQQVSVSAKQAEQTLMLEAQKRVQSWGTKYQQNIVKETDNLKESLSRKVKQEVFAISRKTLTELASTTLEQQICEVFTARLYKLDDDKKTTLAQALNTNSEFVPALIQSAFELTESQRLALKNAINTVFSKDITIKFTTDESLISGIELCVNGQKLVWSIDDYLQSIEQEVDMLLKQKTAQPTTSQSVDK
ncbi:F0F1 ATP synthase subunit delta [Pseudoalteromonas sp. RB2-MNA-CIBAN-0110]|uniref:F0F1 ATP synthase subunit delta n=1 Tax=Pseudoalteromonas sp. RB2-MNA-CIBAN-0110 TaxID=3140439 RepID=UPI003324A971